MKLKWLMFCLFSLSGGWSFFLTPSASAQCVQADVSVQYNISGSRRPTERSSDVSMDSRGPCTGNTSVTTTVQGNEGGNGRVVQRRQARHQFQGGSDNGTGVNPRTVQVKSNVEVDVYNPAERLTR